MGERQTFTPCGKYFGYDVSCHQGWRMDDDEWAEMVDSDGARFFYCARTGESAWERPAAVAASAAADAAAAEQRQEAEAPEEEAARRA